MQRVKIVKPIKGFTVGSVVVIDNNEAFGLIDSGSAILTKDIVATDVKIKSLDEEQANGKPTKLRTHNKS